MSTALLHSPALPLVAEAQALGLRFTLDGDVVRVSPPDQIPAVLLEALRAHRDDVRTLLEALDEGVAARQRVFAEQLAAHGTRAGLPAFIFTPGVPYAAGICFACGHVIDLPAVGRCWRCALAWRLACGLLRLPDPVSAAARDEARDA